MTRDFVKPANEVVHKTLINNKINIVKEKVMHKDEPDYEEVKQFKTGGYEIEMNIMAVDGYESFLCCIERDIELIKNGLDPRRVTKADHDRMYTPFIEELKEFAKRDLCDTINIYGRGESIDKPNLLYSTNKQNENNLNVDESIKAINNERERMHKEIISNATGFLIRIKKAKEEVNELIDKESLKKEYIEQLENLESKVREEITESKEY